MRTKPGAEGVNSGGAADWQAEELALANALRDSLLAVTSLPSVDEVMEQILDSVSSVIRYDGATILIFEDGKARVACARGFAQESLASIHQAFIPTTKTHFQQLQESSEAYVVEDTLQDPEWISIPGAEWIRSSMGAPIIVHNQNIGLIAIDSREPHYFDTNDVARVQLFARYVGLAISNAYQNDLLGQLVAERTAELQRAKEELEAKEAMLRAAQHIAQLGSWFLDVKTATLYWSDELFRIGGFDPAEGIPDEQIVISFVHPDDLVRFEEMIRILRTVGGPTEVEISIIRANDGAERQVLLRSEPIGQPGAMTYMQGIVLDITERKAAEAALRQALEREKEINSLKSRFVAMASHEFRGPLSVIQANVELLKDGWRTLSAEMIDKRLTNILGQSILFNDILRRLLELSQLQAGAVVFNPIALDLANVCREVLVQLRTIADLPTPIQVAASVDPLWVRGDPVYLHRLISNIVGNAQKYSPNGAPIQITLANQGECACVCVADQGIGIPPADLANIFEPFYRGANVQDIPGSGLGMALVKMLVDLHHGQIAIKSELGRGTSVTVHLPLAEPLASPWRTPV